jgi:hypothetical protein
MKKNLAVTVAGYGPAGRDRLDRPGGRPGWRRTGASSLAQQ